MDWFNQRCHTASRKNVEPPRCLNEKHFLTFIKAKLDVKGQRRPHRDCVACIVRKRSCVRFQRKQAKSVRTLCFIHVLKQSLYQKNDYKKSLKEQTASVSQSGNEKTDNEFN